MADCQYITTLLVALATLCVISYAVKFLHKGKFSNTPNFERVVQVVKHQAQLLPIVVEGLNIPAGVFTVIAQANGADCWLQGRVFENGTAVNDQVSTVISLESRVDDEGRLALFRFGTNTGSNINTDEFVANALCLPIHCSNITNATLVSRHGLDSQSTRLFPIEFLPETFQAMEDTPVVETTKILFDKIILATVERPTPFYHDFASCQANALESDDVADPSDYFRFDFIQCPFGYNSELQACGTEEVTTETESSTMTGSSTVTKSSSDAPTDAIQTSGSVNTTAVAAGVCGAVALIVTVIVLLTIVGLILCFRRMKRKRSVDGRSITMATTGHTYATIKGLGFPLSDNSAYGTETYITTTNNPAYATNTETFITTTNNPAYATNT